MAHIVSYLYTKFKSYKSMNWYIIIPSGLAIIGLIVFMVRHNYKEKKIFENELNTNYPKSKHEDDNGEVEEES